MPWMSSVSSRHGTHARVERVLRELHAGPAAWARRMRALLRPDRWRDAMPPVLARRRGGAGGEARSPPPGLAAVLWRHVRDHERCLARAVCAEAFDVITTVPSSDAGR